MAELKTSIVLDLIDRVSRPISKIEQRFSQFSQAQSFQRLSRSASNIGQQWAGVTEQAGRLTSRLAILGGAAAAGGYAFKRLFVDTASQFEQFRTVLETLEGSSGKAEQSMRWISRFATRTPYELSQVTDAYVRLRAYGLDPTTGLLRTLGDTAASMNKPLMASVEAMADAVNGEYERLKEFGITTMTQGNRTAFQYINASGKQITKVVDNRNKAMISSTLQAIWSSRYGGAMSKLSGTWSGMISNISDQWTRFANLVMDSGVFDWMKSRLRELLDRIHGMAASGELKQLAERVGKNLVQAFKQFYQAARTVWSGLQQVGSVVSWLADRVGGFGNLILGLAGILSVQFAAAVATTIASIVSLGTALLLTPVGWFLGAIALIAGAAYLIYRNWGGISQWFADRWSDVGAAFDAGIGGIARLLMDWSPLGLLYRGITAALGTLGIKVPDKFKTLGGVIIDGLWAGLVSAWNSVTGWVKGRFAALSEMFSGFSLSEIGSQWVDGLRSGIAAQWEGLTGWLSNKMDALTGWLPDWAQGKLGLDGLDRPSALGGKMLSGDTIHSALAVAGDTRVGGELRITIDNQGAAKVSDLRKDGPMDIDVYLGDRRAWN